MFISEGGRGGQSSLFLPTQTRKKCSTDPDAPPLLTDYGGYSFLGFHGSIMTLSCRCAGDVSSQRNLLEPARGKHICGVAVHFYSAHRLQSALFLLRYGLCLYRGRKKDAGRDLRGGGSPGR